MELASKIIVGIIFFILASHLAGLIYLWWKQRQWDKDKRVKP
ncbi:hypothetical protein ES705_27316 [subsurface metagenome]